jgi:trans-aconitate methyltransferase
MKTYDWNARDYEKHSVVQQQWAKELIVKLNLQGSEDILDLGCGDGKITAQIAGMVHGGSVVGVDNSLSMIELASEKYPAHQYSNLSFMVMDAVELTFVEQFDVVFSNAALHWVQNHRPVLNGIYRSLNPGGKILLQMGGKGNAGDIISALTRLQSKKEWRPYFNDFEFPYGFWGKEAYTQLLKDAGFAVHRVELIPKDMVHEGQSGLEGWIRTTWLPYIQQVPEEKRDEFIRALSSEYIHQVPLDSDGKVHVAMVRLEVEAKKKPS